MEKDFSTCGNQLAEMAANWLKAAKETVPLGGEVQLLRLNCSMNTNQRWTARERGPWIPRNRTPTTIWLVFRVVT